MISYMISYSATFQMDRYRYIPVHTKYPVLVHLVTIPDVRRSYQSFWSYVRTPHFADVLPWLYYFVWLGVGSCPGVQPGFQMFTCHEPVVTVAASDYMRSGFRTVTVLPSANWGAIIAYYCNFNTLYALWHYYSLLRRYYCNYCFANVQTIILHYCIISKKTVIALMAILLFHLLFSAYIIAIIDIITLLFTLLLTHTILTSIFFRSIISIIVFQAHYWNYDNYSLLFQIVVFYSPL